MAVHDTKLGTLTGPPSCGTALRVVSRNAKRKVYDGLRGRPGWSAAQYKAVVQRLVESPHGAVIADELYSELGTDMEAAEAAVQAMVEAKMLAYRPASGGQFAT